MSEDRLDQILDEMRNESVPEAELKAARDRVWRSLMAAAPGACGGFRTQFADYRDDRLPAQQRMLMDDHLSRCATCRRAFAEFRGERKVVAMPVRPVSSLRRWSGWAVAAGVALVALYLGRGPLDRSLAPPGARATVETASAGVYRISGEPLAAGATLNEAGVVRTGTGARAVLRLADGSRVELNERTELSVQAAWSGQTIQLDRGDIVVEAAQQRRGGLHVATRDSLATVRGTVFTVSSASSGSLVAVVEGAVEVQQPGTERVLKPGESAATNSALAQVGVRQAVAWSTEAERYYLLLGDFAHIEKQLMAMPGAGLRNQSRLLALLPAGAHIYGAIPNLGGTLKQAVQLIEQRSAESAALRQWWTSPNAQQAQGILDRIQTVAAMLGDEVVFVGGGAKGSRPLVLAEVRAGQEAALQREIAAAFAGESGHPPAYRINGNLLIVAASAGHLAAVLPTLGQGAGSPFGQEIAKRYARGVSWLLAADLAQAAPGARPEALAVSGFSTARYLFLEQRTVRGNEENEVTVSFNGPRTGAASWLAVPGSAGSAEYVSSDSVLAFSSATRNPRQVYDELMAGFARIDSSFAKQIQEFESKSGVRVGDDLASALGTDFSFSIEAPTIPIPGWFAAIEIYRPAALDDTIGRLVDAFNQALEPARRESLLLTFKKENVNGREWVSLKSASRQVVVHWTFDRGYLVLAMDRAIAAKAVATRNGGFPLVRSARYQQMLPASAGLHQSAFFWLNTQGALGAFANLAPSPALKQMLESRDPVLLIINGEKERIQAASRTRLTSLLVDMLAMGAPGKTSTPGPARAKAHKL